MLCHWEKRLESKGTKKKKKKKYPPLLVFSVEKNNFRISLFSHHFQSAELKRTYKT